MNEDEKIKKRFEEVREAISSNPRDWRGTLMDLGFEYFEEENTEAGEESRAQAENQRQDYLVNYFEGAQAPTFMLLQAFLSEKNADNPNYPLMRRYFKRANKQLKKLLLFGLKQSPTNAGLLNDLSFYNEFSLNLAELAAHYQWACVIEADMEKFKSLVTDFYIAVSHHHYDPFHALLMDGAIDETKNNIVKNLQQEIKNNQEPIRF